MKEVKLVSFSDLTSSEYWSGEYSDEERLSQYEKNRREEARRERPLVEQRLADFLNDGWIIAGIGGESLKSGFVILVREQ
jgi:hypothetical protein